MNNVILHILSCFPDDMERQFLKWGEKKYRLKQLLNWVFQNRTLDVASMGNIPQSLRSKIADKYSFQLPVIVKKSVSHDNSIKYLLELTDKMHIEMVAIPNEKKHTLCVSTQIGCGRKCLFCATGKLGLTRNLSTAEITSQIYLAQLYHPEITNIVFMGMGEPLDNFDSVMQAIQLLQQDRLFSFSPRRMTISTAGVIPNIYKLADSNIKIKLAVSLNAVFNTKRDKLMPINQHFPLVELKKALLYFTTKNPFRVTLEYVMLKEFNMNDEDIQELKKFTGDLSCKVNLIAWNPVDNLPFSAPDEKEVTIFFQKLHELNVAVTLRSSRGSDINAACGQLAAKKQDLFS
jgi:23S rRNA (adenine2503-C2)-methyltransferase